MTVEFVKMSFLKFVSKKLNPKYPLVTNIGIFVLEMEQKGESFRVEASQTDGQLVKYYPAKVDGVSKPFIIGCYTATPDQSVLNLTLYDEVPDFIQVLVDEYEKFNPSHTIKVTLR